MLRRLALAALLSAVGAEAEVVAHRFWIAADTTGTRHQAAFFYVCDTQVELPATATEGDQAWAADTDKFFVWDGAAWLEIGAGGGGTTPTGTGFRHVTAGAEDAASALVTLTDAAHVAANQGTTTTVLHGNAAGQASFAAVDLTNDTSSVLPLAKLTDDGSGTAGNCLLSGSFGSDPAWGACPGGGGGLSYAQVAAAALAGF